MVTGHPELVPLSVILDRGVIRTGALAKRSPRDIHVARLVHHEGAGRIVSMVRTVVAGHPGSSRLGTNRHACDRAGSETEKVTDQHPIVTRINHLSIAQFQEGGG